MITAPVPYFEAEQLSVELIVVDDGSRDQSATVVKAFANEHQEVPLRLIEAPVNLGKGAAIRTAIAQADSDFCLVQDADFEYDPIDYPKLLAPLLAGEADVVLGSRFMNAEQRRPFGFWQAVANRGISAFTGIAAGLDLSDVETGYKAFRTSLAQSVPLESNRFGIEPELVIQFARRHARFVEVPVSYRGRTVEEGKKIAAGDALFALGTILRTRLFSAAHTDAAADMLVAMSRAKQFNRWMADTITPWIAGDVLEMGAGIGNLTVLLASGKQCYTATDTDAEHLNELNARIENRPHVKLGLCDFTDPQDMASYAESADTVVCLNSLEHVEDDTAALANIHRCLRPGGVAIVLVPQGPSAFGSMDEVLRHKRRYTTVELRQKMSAAGFQVDRIISFNRATWPGWYLNSRLLRRRTLSRIQLRLFDALVPLWRRIDPMLPWPPTSLIAIGVAGGVVIK